MHSLATRSRTYGRLTDNNKTNFSRTSNFVFLFFLQPHPDTHQNTPALSAHLLFDIRLRATSFTTADIFSASHSYLKHGPPKKKKKTLLFCPAALRDPLHPPTSLSNETQIARPHFSHLSSNIFLFVSLRVQSALIAQQHSQRPFLSSLRIQKDTSELC